MVLQQILKNLVRTSRNQYENIKTFQKNRKCIHFCAFLLKAGLRCQKGVVYFAQAKQMIRILKSVA